MDIAVIGTGNVGSVLGRRWAEAGYGVCYGSRHPDRDHVKALADHSGANVEPPAAAVAAADVVLLAVPGAAVLSVVEELGDLAGKVVIDCTNRHSANLAPRTERASLAERIADLVPRAHVVKAFNATGAANMERPQYPDGTLIMPYCGDNDDAKETVRELISVLGFEPVDNGALELAHSLEGMAIMWISLAYTQGWGPNFGFAVHRRNGS